MAIKKEFGVGLIIASVCLMIFAAAALFLLPGILKPTVDVSVGNGIFKSRLAKTSTERVDVMSEANGMSGSNAILLAYPSSGKWPVDISGVKDLVDVVWMDNDKKVTSIYRNASNATIKSGRLTASAMVRYVMILPSGSINMMAIGTNRTATFQINIDEIK